MYGYTSEEMIGRSMSTLMPPDHPDERSGILQRLEQGESIDHYETARIRKDGRRIDVSLTISPIRDPAGHVSGASVIARDTTERNRAEDEIRRSRQQLRALSAHLQTVREEERTRIARELHDELGQALTSLKMELLLLEEAWSNDRTGNRRTPLQRMTGLIDDSIQTVRKIATGLRPMMLDNLGLPAAMEWLADEFVRTSGLSCDVALPEEDVVLDRDTSTALFRILQESLTNIVRHAKASNVTVRLWNENQTTVLRVQDDGVGISPQSVAGATSFGLLSMKERAIMLGGTLDVTVGPGAGTTVTARVPHPPSRDEPVQG
jgi:PAS domain S-box-containing protein